MADSVGAGVTLQECAGCRSRLFPARLRCPACGSREFRQVRITSGRVDEVTSIPGTEQAIATVSGNGVTVIARVPTATRAGDDIRLTDDPRDAEAAFVPTAVTHPRNLRSV